MTAPTWACVVPTNRPERFAEFLEEWLPLFAKYMVKLFVIQDLPAHDPQIKRAFDYAGLEGELHHWGSIRAKQIPHRTDMVRSWGIYRAWKAGASYTLSLDDDTSPYGDLFAEYERVFTAGAPVSRYLDVGALTSFDGQMRGFPYRDRERGEVGVQYGGWNGVLDYDARTQLAGVNEEETFLQVVLAVPKGAAVTGCIMNACWRTELAPLMWQLPLLSGRFNRFGDIWAGLFAKKTLDALGKVMVVNGRALVRHERASDPEANLERERPGIPLNERLWHNLRGADYQAVTDSAFAYFAARDLEYAQHFLRARNEWLGLFA